MSRKASHAPHRILDDYRPLGRPAIACSLRQRTRVAGAQWLLLLPTCEQLAEGRPDLVAPMRHYLEHIRCGLRPATVKNTHEVLRSFSGLAGSGRR